MSYAATILRALPLHPVAPAPEAPKERVRRELYAVCADTRERLTEQTVRAYGMAFTLWMTGRSGFDMGNGPRSEQHARISRHFRGVLADGITQKIDQTISERTRSGRWPAPLLDPRSADAIDSAAVKAETLQSAQSLFLRGQYRVNLLFFALFADLERGRQRAGIRAGLLGATARLEPPPHVPEP